MAINLINPNFNLINTAPNVGTGSRTGMSDAAGGAESSLPRFSDILETVISGSTASLDEIFQKASDTYHVPVELLKAVAKAESNFNPRAESHAGAKGIMQLMPGTAKALGVTDPFDPEQSIMGGAKYLSQQLARYDGNAVLALAAYNAGPGNVAKYNGVPPFKETQNYISKVMGYAGETITAGEASLPGIANAVDMDVRDYALLMDLYRYRMQLSVLTESEAESDSEPNDLFGNMLNLV
jgi:hypothetical protein